MSIQQTMLNLQQWGIEKFWIWIEHFHEHPIYKAPSEHDPILHDCTFIQMEPGTPLTKSEITKAYRAASKTYHPDKGGSDAEFRQLSDVRDRLYKQAKKGEKQWVFSNTWLFDVPCLMDASGNMMECEM